MSKIEDRQYNWKIAFWITASIVLFVCVLNLFNIFLKFENQTIDFRFALRGVRAPQAPVKILGVDEKSLSELGQWPWPRSIHAQIIRRLKEDGVKCVFYDVVFAEPEHQQTQMFDQLTRILNATSHGVTRREKTFRKKLLSSVQSFESKQDGDADLAKAIKDAGNVYLLMEPMVNGADGRGPNPASLNVTPAKLLDGPGEDIIPCESLITSIPEIQNASVDSGHTRCFPFGDDIFRYYPTVLNYQETLIPHLALQVVRHFLGDKTPVEIHDGQYAQVAGRKIPILRNGFALIDYCGPPGTIPTYSICDVLDNRIDPGALKGSVVVVGTTADGLSDIRPTPFTRNATGVDMNANIIENVISGNFLTLSPWYVKYLLMILLAALIFIIIPLTSPLFGTLGFFALLIGYVAVACLLFIYSKLIIDITHPSLAMTLTFMALTTYKFRTEVRRGMHMKNMFRTMVTPKVVDAILRMPAKIELGGEEKQLTVMFTDIRGFTTYSEKHTPHEVIQVLNEYLTQMTNMIFKVDGTLDKYIGDAIMAFWGAPVVQEDHAYRACVAALGMRDLLHDYLHPKWKAEGKEKLQMGVGLNTGGMVVGFVGSEAIKNYTLIGDAVNLGSRLEGTTKEYHVEIVMSESTYQVVKWMMLCRELDLIQVKGKAHPVHIYELVNNQLNATEDQKTMVAAFEKGLALYRVQRWGEAIEQFNRCLDIHPQDGPSAIFLERCRHLQEAPPEPNWDGVYVMKTK